MQSAKTKPFAGCHISGNLRGRMSRTGNSCFALTITFYSQLAPLWPSEWHLSSLDCVWLWMRRKGMMVFKHFVGIVIGEGRVATHWHCPRHRCTTFKCQHSHLAVLSHVLCVFHFRWRETVFHHKYVVSYANYGKTRKEKRKHFYTQCD